MSTLQYVGRTISEGRALTRQDPTLAREVELARPVRARWARRSAPAA